MAKKEHCLKVLREFFDDIKSGRKTFEVRRDDRSYAEGDMLVLEEYDPHATITGQPKYTGRKVKRVITYKMPGGRFGLDPDFCILGLGNVR